MATISWPVGAGALALDGKALNVFGDEDMLCGRHLLRICSPTVVFTARPISVPALRLKLPTCGTPFRRVTPSEILALHQVQGQLLKYRLTQRQVLERDGW